MELSVLVFSLSIVETVFDGEAFGRIGVNRDFFFGVDGEVCGNDCEVVVSDVVDIAPKCPTVVLVGQEMFKLPGESKFKLKFPGGFGTPFNEIML